MSEEEVRIREVIEAWPNTAELASYAAQRHGYGSTDGGFGVTYPGDFDEYQRVVEKISIPEGSVEIYGYWGLPNGYEQVLPEKRYLLALATVLREKGLEKEAEDVERLARHRG